jgi:arylsulfatase/arylsulfatase A
MPARALPNVILIMTDDQGIGDLGVMGNPVIETPRIDRLASESAWLTNFYVHPVCAPTRACLMTGRYNYRTRAIDTYIGRAMMEPDEVTLAEVLSAAGYATGIFGKWHLGDCYPMRAMDQGFETAVVHRGGGIGQPSDPLQARRQYTDPVLFRNGVAEAFHGYCTDIYYREACAFIERARDAKQPFFVYLPDNTPHGPFHDVPEDLYRHYLSKKITPESFPNVPGGHPVPQIDADFLARVFAMISNVDRNVGRLLDRLEQLELTDNTIVIFMCDNGPNSRRFVRGYRANKGSVYEGGIRSPFFIRWPGNITAGLRVPAVAAHIDVMPTLLGLAGLPVPEKPVLDGRDLGPLLRGETETMPERNLFIQSHRGNAPVRYHHVAVRNQQWKLVHASGFSRESLEKPPQFELFDMVRDPFETTSVAAQHPDMVTSMRAAYDQWFDDVSSTRPDNYAPPRIVIDAARENPVVLTRQDWRRTRAGGWGDEGFWLVRIEQPTILTLNCRLLDDRPSEQIQLLINGQPRATTSTDENGRQGTFRDIRLHPGDYEMTAVARHNDRTEGVFQIEVRSARVQSGR